ncbi:MAG: hypothetical protein ABI114_02380 [Rhodanobacter sp.]
MRPSSPHAITLPIETLRPTTVDSRLATVRSKLQRFIGSPRPRRITLTVFIVLTVFNSLGLFAAPPIIKSQLQTRLTTLFNRPVSLGEVHFNTFTLRLQRNRTQIVDREQ